MDLVLSIMSTKQTIVECQHIVCVYVVISTVANNAITAHLSRRRRLVILY